MLNKVLFPQIPQATNHSYTPAEFDVLKNHMHMPYCPQCCNFCCSHYVLASCSGRTSFHCKWELSHLSADYHHGSSHCSGLWSLQSKFSGPRKLAVVHAGRKMSFHALGICLQSHSGGHSVLGDSAEKSCHHVYLKLIKHTNTIQVWHKHSHKKCTKKSVHDEQQRIKNRRKGTTDKTGTLWKEVIIKLRMEIMDNGNNKMKTEKRTNSHY